MTLSCGRVRKHISRGLTPIIERELKLLNLSVLKLEGQDEHVLQTSDREYAVVLIRGRCSVVVDRGPTVALGPREDPFEHPPHAIFATRDQELAFRADGDALVALGSAPAQKRLANAVVTPGMVKTAQRGAQNWTRTVRTVCWSDNTEGNLLLAGETCTSSGNWSTMPPHRHQYDIPGHEVPYEEIYFFQFSRPSGFGLAWQFDDEGELDQAFSLMEGDALYMDGGYHPIACAPGSTLYHLSLMAGPRRMSKASVHRDFQFLLDRAGIENQYNPDLK